MKPDFPNTSSQSRPDFPLVSKDLLDRLAEIFPDALPMEPDFTLRDADRAFGAQRVIARLRDEYNRQNKIGPYAR